MVRTESTMSLALDASAPDFSLLDVHGNTVSLADVEASPGLLVAFICNHCPFVKHIREGFADFAREYEERGLAILAINSNDVETHTADSPAAMKIEAEQAGYGFPYLFDETQIVAQAYKAACTPDFFLFDRDRRLVYRGQFDGSRPDNDVPVTGHDLRAAADAVLAGIEPATHQHPSIGCNIKWKAGNEPSYFPA
jgi:peroxiredoxin